MVSYGYMPGSGVLYGGTGDGDDGTTGVDEPITDNASIIRLLRVFVGALQDLQDEDSSLQERPKDPSLSPRAQGNGPGPGDSPSASTGRRRAASLSPPSTSRKRPRISYDDGVNGDETVHGDKSHATGAELPASPSAPPQEATTTSRDPDSEKRERSTEVGELHSERPVERSVDSAHDHHDGAQREDEEESVDNGQVTAVESDTRTDQRSRIFARDRAGCTLWDLSMDEKHAEIMCSCGLLAVCTAVLQHCAAADARAVICTTLGQGGDTNGRSVPDAADDAVGVRNGAGESAERRNGDLDGEEAARLREITCGILANVCSHRSLRKAIAGNAPLGEELLRAFHSSDDPTSLTEILRMFASIVASLGQEDKGPLGAVLVERQTLGRLAFFLENSLEEKLLARACWLLYVLMYRCSDDVMGPLLQDFCVEHALVSLLATRKGDLSFEKLAGTETGLGALLRCLEVLSTSDVSSIGPSMRCAASQALPDQSSSSARADDAPVKDPTLRNGSSEVEVLSKSSLTDVTQEGGLPTACSDKREDDSTARDHAVHAAGGAAGKPSESGEAVRANVIQGLVQVLVPWDYSRECQKTALLVLGNLLEAAEDSQDPRLHQQCSQALEDALSIPKADRLVDKEDDDGKTQAAAGARGFLENVKDVSAGDGVDDEDLREQLGGAYAVIERALRDESRL